MILLADTHAVLWALLRPDELSEEAARALRSPENDVLVSAASAWEISIKADLGKLKLPGAPAEWLPPALEKTGFRALDVTMAHALAAGSLPPHHRDPFDRLLVAQALVDGLVIVTRDERFKAYGVAVLPA